jgi:hypothetical protein
MQSFSAAATSCPVELAFPGHRGHGSGHRRDHEVADVAVAADPRPGGISLCSIWPTRAGDAGRRDRFGKTAVEEDRTMAKKRTVDH